mmetsp:Transcript_43049/g.116120  ORF Transcript_43049/g.116120 Transcript_43049/m.116120 type:complete len:219 (+) Transcript_43049:2061-2717(+)
MLNPPKSLMNSACLLACFLRTLASCHVRSSSLLTFRLIAVYPSFGFCFSRAALSAASAASRSALASASASATAAAAASRSASSLAACSAPTAAMAWACGSAPPTAPRRLERLASTTVDRRLNARASLSFSDSSLSLEFSSANALSFGGARKAASAAMSSFPPCPIARMNGTPPSSTNWNRSSLSLALETKSRTISNEQPTNPRTSRISSTLAKPSFRR